MVCIRFSEFIENIILWNVLKYLVVIVDLLV